MIIHGIYLTFLQKVARQKHIQGDPSARGLGYVDINSISLGGYPEAELSQHNPVREQMCHPVILLFNIIIEIYFLPCSELRNNYQKRSV